MSSTPLNLTGQRFGRLTVIRPAEERDKFGCRQWVCRCDCGATPTVRGYCLRRGGAQSCGCLRRERRLNLAGRRFGRLKAIRPAEQRAKFGKIQWLCRCNCGRECTVTVDDLRAGKVRSCGCLRRSACSKTKPFTKKDSRAEHQRAEVRRTADGQDLYALDKAARYVGVTPATLWNWKSECPWDGEGVEPEIHPGAYNKPTPYFAKARLDRIIQARSHLRTKPEVPDHVFFFDLARELNWSQQRLSQEIKARGVTVVKVRAKSRAKKSGDKVRQTGRKRIKAPLRVVMRSYLPRWFADECKRANGQATANGATPGTADGRGETGGAAGRVPAPTAGVSPSVAADRPEFPPTPESSKYSGHVKTTNRAGRRPDPETEKILEFCYDEYVVKDRSRARVLDACRKRFGEEAPGSERAVGVYSDRWADRFIPPLPRKNDPQ
jgi:hypothetical protein